MKQISLSPSETAQGIFVNFHNVLTALGSNCRSNCSAGKAFATRSTRAITRSAPEFEQMEIEFFCHPDESTKWYQYWRDVRIRWYSQLGIKSEKLRPREQSAKSAPLFGRHHGHEYLFPFSDEHRIGGVPIAAIMTLRQHANTAARLELFRRQAWSATRISSRSEEGAGSEVRTAVSFLPTSSSRRPRRSFRLAVLCEATRRSDSDEKGSADAGVMKIHPRLAPIKPRFFRWSRKTACRKAQALYRDLKKQFNVFYDDKAPPPPLSSPRRAALPFASPSTPDLARRHRHHPRP